MLSAASELQREPLAPPESSLDSASRLPAIYMGFSCRLTYLTPVAQSSWSAVNCNTRPACRPQSSMAVHESWLRHDLALGTARIGRNWWIIYRWFLFPLGRPASRSVRHHALIRLRTMRGDPAGVERKLLAVKSLSNCGIGTDGCCRPGHDIERLDVAHSENELLAPPRVTPARLTAGCNHSRDILPGVLAKPRPRARLVDDGVGL